MLRKHAIFIHELKKLTDSPDWKDPEMESKRDNLWRHTAPIIAGSAAGALGGGYLGLKGYDVIKGFKNLSPEARNVMIERLFAAGMLPGAVAGGFAAKKIDDKWFGGNYSKADKDYDDTLKKRSQKN